MEKMLKVKYVSLPNLIVGNNIVPELLVHNCTVGSISRELSPILQPSPRRDWQLAGYRTMQRKLGNSVASEYVAELITDSLGVSESEESAQDPVRLQTRKRYRRKRQPQREASGS